MVPAAVFMIFCTGVNAGILIGRRISDPLEWLQVVLLAVTSGLMLWPTAREFMIRRKLDEKNDGQ